MGGQFQDYKRLGPLLCSHLLTYSDENQLTRLLSRERTAGGRGEASVNEGGLWSAARKITKALSPTTTRNRILPTALMLSGRGHCPC